MLASSQVKHRSVAENWNLLKLLKLTFEEIDFLRNFWGNRFLLTHIMNYAFIALLQLRSYIKQGNRLHFFRVKQRFIHCRNSLTRFGYVCLADVVFFPLKVNVKSAFFANWPRCLYRTKRQSISTPLLWHNGEHVSSIPIED